MIILNLPKAPKNCIVVSPSYHCVQKNVGWVGGNDVIPTNHKQEVHSLLYFNNLIDKLSMREQGSTSMKTELLYGVKEEWTVVLQCYSEFHGWRADHQTL